MKSNTYTILKTANVASTLLAVITLSIGCNKQPTAGFSTDKSEYTAGDIVKVTNESDNAKSYKWTFPNGQTSTKENDEFVLAETTPGGEYSITLETFSRNGKKTSSITKTITVKLAWGEGTVWTSDPLADSVTVNVSNIYVVLAELHPYTSYPGCNTGAGTLKIIFPVGTYSISATKKNLTWHVGTVMITRDNCTACELK